MPNMIHLIFSIIAFMVLIRCILSWVPDLRRQFREISNIIELITDPILKPFQLLLPARATGNVDFSPIIAIFVLQMIEKLVVGMLRY